MLLLGVILSALALAVSGTAQCGRTPVQPLGLADLIVGGKEAKPFSWPWMVSVYHHSMFFDSPICGASIVSERFLLSAAHCFEDRADRPQAFAFKVGMFSKKAKGVAMEQTVMAAKIHMNPEFNYDFKINDIALVELKEPLVFNDHVQPVCVACNMSLAPGDLATVTGWGTTAMKARTQSDTLQQVKVMMCAGAKGKDNCRGDAGGPLVAQRSDGSWAQVGLASWGDGCALASKPGIYTRLSAYQDFLFTKAGLQCV